MNNILSRLHTIPMFRLSLASKELFHSNFLEFLWDIDQDMSIRILNKLLTYGKSLDQGPNSPNYELSREKENFDICIFHKENNSIVYDLIIENKVKSIPHKIQLDKYVNKVSKNKGNQLHQPIYLLLSLVDNFEGKNDILNSGWILANYSDLKKAIDSEKDYWSQKTEANYISDYCEFIGHMHNFQQCILQNINNTQLFENVDICRKYRLHDLYIKLRCCEFLMQLKNKLIDRGFQQNEISFTENYKEIRTDKKPQVYLNYNIFKGVGQAAALIYTCNTDDGNIYEIVIQGNQYRHGINSRKYALENIDKISSQQNIWNEVCNNSFIKDSFFNLSKPDKATKGRNNAFNGYNGDYVYKYDLITNETVDVLLDRMTDDVLKVYENYVRKIAHQP